MAAEGAALERMRRTMDYLRNHRHRLKHVWIGNLSTLVIDRTGCPGCAKAGGSREELQE